jgi:hypothetical protein
MERGGHGQAAPPHVFVKPSGQSVALPFMQVTSQLVARKQLTAQSAEQCTPQATAWSQSTAAPASTVASQLWAWSQSIDAPMPAVTEHVAPLAHE